jgi:hypothetical protein
VGVQLITFTLHCPLSIVFLPFFHDFPPFQAPPPPPRGDYGGKEKRRENVKEKGRKRKDEGKL